MLLFDYRAGVLIVSSFLIVIFFSKTYIMRRSIIIRFIILSGATIFGSYIFFNFSEVYAYLINIISKVEINKIDTRSFLFVEFFNDVKGKDLVFGKGYLGKYYSPYFKDWEGESGDHSFRFSIEVGYLQIILKGGIVLVLAFLVVVLSKAYKGFVSSNLKSWQIIASFWLLIELLMLTVENIPAFNLHFLYIWILIGILDKQQLKTERIA